MISVAAALSFVRDLFEGVPLYSVCKMVALNPPAPVSGDWSKNVPDLLALMYSMELGLLGKHWSRVCSCDGVTDVLSCLRYPYLYSVSWLWLFY